MLPIVSGLDGFVTVIPHATFPGVLIRVESTWDAPEMRVVRSVEGGSWEPVRSGDPVRMLPDGGVRAGHAFDLAAIPGRQVAYTTAFADTVQTRRAVSIRLPEFARDSEPGQRAWMKHGADPQLSREVRLIEDGPLRQVSVASSSATVFGARWPSITSAGVSQVSFPLTVLCRIDAGDVQGVRALMETPGPILLQAGTNIGLYDQWVALGGDITEAAGPFGYRLIKCDVVEVAAPATLGAPLIIPGPTYADLRPRAVSWTHFAQEYPSSFDLLLAACGRPYGADRDGSAYTGADRVDA